MLRITPTSSSDGLACFTVEGRLSGEFVSELSRLAAAAGGIVRLDLAHVTFVDEAGARVLRELRDRGAVLVNLSEFVLAMLNGGQR